VSGEAASVAGVWYGRWHSDDALVPPNRFIAVIEEVGGAIDGRVSEPDPAGAAPLRSTLHGGRVGSQLQWIKQYDAGGRVDHAVYYAGRVDAEATRISGNWRFERYSGGFSMYRETFAFDMVDAAVDERDIARRR
jgi:hypothetical protein